MTIAHVDSVFPDEMKRDREWKRMAESLHIEIVEDEALAAARRDRALAAVEAELGGMD